eukprot:1946416-Amphidinium_carterae.1
MSKQSSNEKQSSARICGLRGKSVSMPVRASDGHIRDAAREIFPLPLLHPHLCKAGKSRARRSCQRRGRAAAEQREVNTTIWALNELALGPGRAERAAPGLAA